MNHKTVANRTKERKPETEPAGSGPPDGSVAFNPVWHNMATAAETSVAAEPSPVKARPVPRVQPKLTVGAADDEYEREADAVAETVMRATAMPPSGARTSLPAQVNPLNISRLQRSCASCNGGAEGEIQVKSKPPGEAANGVPGSVQNAIASPGAGLPLSAQVRERVESVVGADLSDVRIHTDGAAHQASHDLHARAFAHQNNIFLGSGESSTDLRLMAHETAHVMPKPLETSRVSRSPCGGGEGAQIQAESAGAAMSGMLGSVQRAVASPGAGSPLPEQVRNRVEPVLGADLSHVRVHSDSQSQLAARDINAKAFTNRHNIFLGVNQRRDDVSLMAHEATHVVQQNAASRAGAAPAGVQRAPDGVGGNSAAATGQRCDGNESNPIIWFEYNSTRIRSDSEVNSTIHLMHAVRRAQTHISNVGPGAKIFLYGYASEEGDELNNHRLSTQRAEAIKGLLEDAGVDSANLAAIGRGEDTSLGRRPMNRRVEICPTPSVEYIDMPAETITGESMDCAHPRKAASLTEYAFLVRCLESRLAATHGPVDILRTLREFYYGGDKFDNAACGERESGTVAVLSMTAPILSSALSSSKVTAGVDVGHIFTGLEGMLCPRRRTSPASWAPSVNMANEDFLTWGGDLGSAAAGRLRGLHDSGWVFKTEPPWSRYFLTSGSFASKEDLLGDIDAFSLRANIKGFVCATTKNTRMPSPSTPISRLLLDYYGAPPGMATGLTQADRFRCFVEAVGGVISGGKIVNKAALVALYAPQVNSFANLFYLGMRWHHLFTSSHFDPITLAIYSHQITGLFFDWVEMTL